MSEKADHKAWQAHASRALEFYLDHGGESMAVDDRAEYEKLVAAARETARRHDKTRRGEPDAPRRTEPDDGRSTY